MAKTLLGALALAFLPSAFAFRNTSPFFLFSTAELSINGNDAEVALSKQISEQVIESLRQCPSKTYIVVRQDGVASTDFPDSLAAPRLATYMGGKNADIKSTMAVPEVVGLVDADLISHHLQTKCGAEVVQVDASKRNMPSPPPPTQRGAPQIIELTLPTPPVTFRSAAFDRYDAALEEVIVKFAGSQDFTVFYTTTALTEKQATAAQNEHTYEMEDPFGGAVQMELKRDTASARRAAKSNQGGLFEKYQFFTPALFMGICAIIPLFLVTYVGLTALTSLEVSYFAFSKEMGPNAQKRQ